MYKNRLSFKTLGNLVLTNDSLQRVTKTDHTGGMSFTFNGSTTVVKCEGLLHAGISPS